MIELLNTLYVTTQGAYLRLDHDTVKVEVEQKPRLQVPLHHVGRIVAFGNVLISPFLMHRAAEEGRAVVLLSEHGRFKGRVVGPTAGNILLRHTQHTIADDAGRALAIAQGFLAGKIHNSRANLMRAAREAPDDAQARPLKTAARTLAESLKNAQKAASLDQVRGIEGYAARTYFDAFNRMIRVADERLLMKGRTRRPPRDPVNALLSFLYALVLADCTAAVEGVGLDPQVGFLHGLRPGKPAGGLDLMEEFRPLMADRVALTLINRRQIAAKDFDERPGGAVLLNDNGRKTVLAEYQRRKQDEITHPVLGKPLPLGLAPHVQSQMLARHLRGDAEAYLPFTPK